MASHTFVHHGDQRRVLHSNPFDRRRVLHDGTIGQNPKIDKAILLKLFFRRSLVKANPSLGPLRSYSTVKRVHAGSRPDAQAEAGRTGALAKLARKGGDRRARSAATKPSIVGALWHLDFHHGSLKVLTPGGQWLRPIALGILDDHSRLCCHIQWYLSETAEDLVHGLSQAIQKRGLPRALLTDNGSAMVAEEVTEGLLRLGIVHERTLPYSPYQNGKQEAFWGTLEGRLMKMLDGVAELTLERLQRGDPGVDGNRVQPRRAPRNSACSPVERFEQAPTCSAIALERVAPRRVSPGNQADSAAKRWHDLARRRTLRDSSEIPPLP